MLIKGGNMKFRIIGKMKINNKEQLFRKIIEAQSEKFVVNKLYSIMGNSHGLKRKEIKIEKIESI